MSTSERRGKQRGGSAAAAPKPHEVTTEVLRTADELRRRVAAALAPQAITSQQYNVLRILRGAYPDPLPTLEVGARMIEKTPGITRLLDRLEELELVKRVRGVEDRRLVECRITEGGLSLLAELDEPINEVNRDAVRALTPSERRSLVRLLGIVRNLK
ncbi:MAG TPA: MarR family winged helix-turn-helix transcriptional regulator [Gemmatimonadaceae bacterium]|nr:MarR family winged helix-turn-helix transcriptional regulator [Gemmatimonadaceae bacterium]